MDGWIKIGTKIDTKSFDAQIDYIENQIEEIEYKLKQADMGFEVGDISKLESQYEKLSMKLTNLKQKQADLNKTDLSNVQKSIDNVGKSTSNAIKKVTKWSLAIFGVRAAYGFVRNAVSTLSQYNEKLATDIEYIKFAMASALQPVIETMVQLVYKLLTYVNYISKAWFGIDIFANASAKAMQKSAKSAEKIKKSLAGFDEMNVLNNNGTSGAMETVPSFDLTAPEDITIPSWLQWIKDNKDIVIAGLLGISAGLLAIKLGASALIGLGIGLLLAGVIILIQNLISFLKDPTFENFIGIIEGIGVAIAGVGIIVGSLPVAIAGAVALIVALIVKNYDKIMNLFNKLIKWFEKDFVNALVYMFGPLGNLLSAPFIYFVNFAKGAFESFYGGIKKVVTGIVQLFKGDFKNGIKNVFDGLKGIMLAPINALISGINSMIRGINKIKFDVPDWVPSIGGKKLGFNIKEIPKLASGGIINMPGKGVPLAIGGEAGREGVIPLTDSQAMEELGRTIGRYITINATMVNQMNGRTISREFMKIQNESAFATNR